MVDDLGDTIHAIIDAANEAPLSIIIIGVGICGFEDIKRLTDCFDNLIKERKAGNITIDVSDEEINTLYSIIYKISSQIPPEEMTPIDEKCYKEYLSPRLKHLL